MRRLPLHLQEDAMTRVPRLALPTTLRRSRRALALLTSVSLVLSLAVVAALAPSATRAAGFATLVKEVNPSNSEAGIYEQAVMGGRLFFVATDAEYGEELRVTDGTAAGTRIVRDIAPPGATSGVGNLTPIGDTLFFTAVPDGSYTSHVWRSDGTAAGTFPIWPTSPQSNAIARALINVNGTLFFRVDGGYAADELWKSDGTAAGTTLVKAVGQDSDRYEMAVIGDTVFLVAGPYTRDQALWKSDGTPDGTILLQHFPNTDGVDNLTVLNGALYFAARAPELGKELWRSDGTPEGTAILVDINPGDPGSSPEDIVTLGDRLFFFAWDEVRGRALWTSDGTTVGTGFVTSPPVDTNGNLPYSLVSTGGRLFFVGADDQHGVELWSSDGTAAGTQLVRDIAPGPESSNPTELTNIDGTLYFAASDSRGNEPWHSDGTAAGTTLVQDIAPLSSYPTAFIGGSGLVFFSATNNGTSRQLWAYDPNALPPNLLANGGFELDANNDGRPDGWSTSSAVTRSDAVVHSGSYAMRHAAARNTSYTIEQRVGGIQAGLRYAVEGWVNIPPTSDKFTFRIEIRWRTARDAGVGTSVVQTYNAATAGWSQAAAEMVAPPRATSAQVRLVVSSLKGPIYIDDLALRAAP